MLYDVIAIFAIITIIVVANVATIVEKEIFYDVNPD